MPEDLVLHLRLNSMIVKDFVFSKCRISNFNKTLSTRPKGQINAISVSGICIYVKLPLPCGLPTLIYIQKHHVHSSRINTGKIHK